MQTSCVGCSVCSVLSHARGLPWLLILWECSSHCDFFMFFVVCGCFDNFDDVREVGKGEGLTLVELVPIFRSFFCRFAGGSPEFMAGVLRSKS